MGGQGRAATSTRERIAQLAATGDKSVVVDYEDIIQFNTDLGESLLSQPDESLKEFKMAAFEVLSTENASYAGQVKNILTVRIRGITDKIPLRKVNTSHLDKMIAVAGMVVRTLRAQAAADGRGLRLPQRARHEGDPGGRRSSRGRSSAKGARRRGTSSSTRRGARSSTARS